jgi:hypothetical protein
MAANSAYSGQAGELSSSDEVGSAAGVVAAADVEVDEGAGVLVVGSWVVGSSVVGSSVVGSSVVGSSVVGFAVVGFAVVGFAVVGCTLVGGAVVGAALVGAAVVGSAVVGSAVVGCAVVGCAVVDASDGRVIPLRLGLAVTDLVADGREMLGAAVRLGRASPEPPPQPAVSPSVSTASAAVTSLAFVTAAPSSVRGRSPRVWRGTRPRASHAADERPAYLPRRAVTVVTSRT